MELSDLSQHWLLLPPNASSANIHIMRNRLVRMLLTVEPNGSCSLMKGVT